MEIYNSSLIWLNKIKYIIRIYCEYPFAALDAWFWYNYEFDNIKYLKK